jgi:hypothetical protein
VVSIKGKSWDIQGVCLVDEHPTLKTRYESLVGASAVLAGGKKLYMLLTNTGMSSLLLPKGSIIAELYDGILKIQMEYKDVLGELNSVTLGADEGDKIPWDICPNLPGQTCKQWKQMLDKYTHLFTEKDGDKGWGLHHAIPHIIKL